MGQARAGCPMCRVLHPHSSLGHSHLLYLKVSKARPGSLTGEAVLPVHSASVALPQDAPQGRGVPMAQLVLPERPALAQLHVGQLAWSSSLPLLM